MLDSVARWLLTANQLLTISLPADFDTDFSVHSVPLSGKILYKNHPVDVLGTDRDLPQHNDIVKSIFIIHGMMGCS